ncbi:hypothetical protein GGI15_002104 [Coemansia interrupta]|uniref:Uncharacterized protein n=1 Tax=Coemansia interrupta TaxID=1126814 RepID=A0A9W8LM95_9FUNG|nr:hypothetical protein GGI15_002104 [Coemansia interrupta]
MHRRRVVKAAQLAQTSVFGDSASSSESEDSPETKAAPPALEEPSLPPPPSQPSHAENASSTNLVVHNLSPHTTERHLTRAFSRFGSIVSVKIMWPRGGAVQGSTGNTAFVSFDERTQAEQAMRAMDGARVDNREVHVAWARTQPRHQAVAMPEDPQVRRLVHWTADHVLAHGAQFEHALIQRRASDGRFDFLTAWRSPEHAYYRWRLYSRANGDARGRWRTQPFRMYDDREAPLVRPPGVPQGSVRMRFGRRVDRAMRPATGRRAVASAMRFAVEHAADADVLVDEVCRALGRCSAGGRPLGALHVVSDVLHNSAVARVPGVWRLRAAVERRLDDLFAALKAAMGTDEYRGVLAVLAVWHVWMVFPEQRLVGLAQMFM